MAASPEIQKIIQIKSLLEQVQIKAAKSGVQSRHWKKLESAANKFDRVLEKLDSIPSQAQRIKKLSTFADITVLLGVVGMLSGGLLLIYLKQRNRAAN